jgi:hypothetical protein
LVFITSFLNQSQEICIEYYFLYLYFWGQLATLFLTIELNLCSDKNGIQKLMDNYFGKEIEGNVTSKIVLGIGSMILGIILLKDYGFLNI